eukprot:11124463-Lingulodinium_polyedra.AAC.1
MDSQWTSRGLPMDCPWRVHGLSMYFPWTIKCVCVREQSIGSSWIGPGLFAHRRFMGSPSRVHGQSMYIPWTSQ